MKTITFNIHRGEGIISKGIMFVGEGRIVTMPDHEDATFSHTSTDFGNDRYEAVMFGGYVKNGQQKVNYSPVIESYEMEVTDEMYEYLRDWAERKSGNKDEPQVKYDYTGVFSNIFPIFMKPKKGKLYCSEANNILFEMAQGNKPDFSMTQKISPTGHRNKVRSHKSIKRVKQAQL